MRVMIPSPLLSYTKRREVTAEGATLEEVLRDLERQFPGIRFRMVDEQDQLRPHMRVFVGQQELRELATPLDAATTLHLIQALSGG
ncbi:MAG: MoaD/ThiS family protein [Casimicrobiaceae bacterium]